MSKEQFNTILNRLSSYFFIPFSSSELKHTERANFQEQQLIEGLKKQSLISEEELKDKFLGLINLSEEEKKKKLELDDLDEQEKGAVLYILKQVGISEGIDQAFNEQYLAIVRGILDYKRIKRGEKKGKIFEMATGEGKSSIVIPVLSFYLSLFEEQIHLHTANQYLALRDFERLKTIGEKLGINISYLDNPFDFKPLDKSNKIVVGQWQDFIHSFQNVFLKRLRGKKIESKEEDKVVKVNIAENPFFIADEVDQLAYDELATPAVISEPISDRDIFQRYFKEKEKEIKAANRKNGRQVYDLQGLEYRPLRQFYEYFGEKGEKIEGFLEIYFSIAQMSYNRLLQDKRFQKTDKKGKITILEDFLRKNFLVAEFLTLSELTGMNSNELSQLNENERDNLIRQKIGGIKEGDRLDRLIKKRLKQANNKNVYLYWEDFIEYASQALVMQRGVDYEVFRDGENIEIKPLSSTSGYAQLTKEFNDWLKVFLRIKEGDIVGNIRKRKFTDNVDEISVYSFYNRPLIGFTGTATSIARRLYEVYQFETQRIPKHNQTTRVDEGFEIVENWQKQKQRLVEILTNQENNKDNILIVVDTEEQAKEIETSLKEKDQEQLFDIGLLTTSNQYLDQVAYTVISSKPPPGQKRVLIVTKMIGRGVDIKPDDGVKQKGMLMISLTPFYNQRAYEQLLGRLGRRGEKGRTKFIISPENEDIKKYGLKKRITLSDVFNIWERNENEAIAYQRQRAIFESPFKQLRDFIIYGKKQPIMRENYWDTNEFREFLANNWMNLIEAARFEFFNIGRQKDLDSLVSLWPVYFYEKLTDWYKRATENKKRKERKEGKKI